MRFAITILALVAAADAGPATFKETFDDAPAGAVAPGFTSDVGRWVVVALPEGGRALAQAAENPDEVFNVALQNTSNIKDIDMSVRLRAVAGENDRGGGLVWRARDARNYYIARFNPLEDNFRVYKVVDGVRTQLQGADVRRPEGWHALRVRMVGDRIRCDLDGKTLLDITDKTFGQAGKVGLWTKSDARTQFDDLTVRTPE